MSHSQGSTRSKRLIVLSDGTWQTPENVIGTNILKLTKAIKLESADSTQQILLYDAGIGTAGPIDRQLGGGLGQGIDVNIKELYTFLSLNYDEGDEVYFFGFSRGAYTVRSLAGMIHESGLVRRQDIDFVHEAYELYRSDEDPESAKSCAFREEHGQRIPITLLACFDTVGSLGLPFQAPGFLTDFDSSSYAFHNTDLSEGVENAIHLMSIDEDRQIFTPTPMVANPARGETQLTQLYFPGGHGGVGGGDAYEEPLSDNALRFMVQEMQRRGLKLEFDMSLIPDAPDVAIPPKARNTSAVLKLAEAFTGKFIREISTIDDCHPSVAKRYQAVSEWRPEALKALDMELLALRFED